MAVVLWSGESCQSLLHSCRLESERPSVTLVGDDAVPVNHIEAIGPARVSDFGGIVEFIDEGGNLKTQLYHAGSGQVHALFVTLRADDLNSLLNVVFVSPEVGGVGFLNVDDKELGAVLVLLIQPVQRGNLPAEGRSGVASKDQNYGPAAAK